MLKTSSTMVAILIVGVDLVTGRVVEIERVDTTRCSSAVRFGGAEGCGQGVICVKLARGGIVRLSQGASRVRDWRKNSGPKQTSVMKAI